MPSQFITKHGLEEDLFNFRSRVEDVVKSMSVSFYALVVCLQNFDYYILQEHTFTKDVMEAYRNSKPKNLSIITEELKFLISDHDRISTTFPKTFDLGMLTVDVKEYFEEVKKKIKLYISQIGSQLETLLVKKITKATDFVKQTIEQFEIVSDDIKGYIQLKLFVDDETKWNEIKDKIVLKQMKYYDIFSYIYDAKVEPNADTLHYFRETSNWFIRLNKAKTEANKKLESLKPSLIAEQKIKNHELKSNLSKKKIDEYDSFYELEHFVKYFETATSMMTQLEDLATKAAEYEEYEFYLNMNPKTDFFEVYKTKNAFKKYYNLWDFIYEWQFVSL